MAKCADCTHSKASRKKTLASTPVLCMKYKAQSKIGNLKPLKRNNSSFPGTAAACKYYEEKKGKK